MSDLQRLATNLFYERDASAFRAAIEAEPDILTFVDDYGKTVLHTFSGNEQYLEIMFEVAAACGVDLDLEVRDEDGNTPLARAFRNYHAPGAAALLRRGADRHALNNAGEPAVNPEASWADEVEQRASGAWLSTLAAVEAAEDPLGVRSVSINDRVDVFPARIVEFTNLEKLTLSSANELEIPSGFGQLTKLSRLLLMAPVRLGPWVGELTSLERLSVQAVDVDPAIGELQALERLSLRFGTLTALPEAVGKLAALTHLDVAHTPIRELPQSVGNLANLLVLDVIATALVDLPDSLDQLRALQVIRLDGCKLPRVPPVLYRMGHVQRDGVEDVPGFEGWARNSDKPKQDATPLFARSRPELLPLLDELVDRTEEQMYEGFLHVARSALALTTTQPATYSRLGMTRFGGRPDLAGPDRPPKFIAQLNLAELAPLQNYLPRKGLLSFYVSKSAVVFVPDVEELDRCDGEEETFAGFDAHAKSAVSIPHVFRDSICKGPAEVLRGLADIDFGGTHEWPQGDHYINSYVYSQSTGPRVDTAAKHGGLAADYVILLAVGSDDRCGFHWGGGVSELCFLIHQDDLLAGDFSNVHIEVTL